MLGDRLTQTLAPQVIAYWLISSSIALHAACLISGGAGKSGIPCARLIAPNLRASTVIPRMTLSVNRDAFCEINGSCIARAPRRFLCLLEPPRDFGSASIRPAAPFQPTFGLRPDAILACTAPNVHPSENSGRHPAAARHYRVATSGFQFFLWLLWQVVHEFEIFLKASRAPLRFSRSAASSSDFALAA